MADTPADTLSQEATPTADLTAKVVVNRRAGSVLEQGEDQFREALSREFAAHGVTADILMTNPREMRTQLQRAIADAPGLVVACGGDGTVNELLPVLKEARIPVGILPLGTLNLFARDLGFTGDVAHDVAELARLARSKVDLAEVNGLPFHSNAGLGLFTMMARERENARRLIPSSIKLGYALATMRTLFRSRPLTVLVETEGEKVVLHADAVLVTNNRFDGTPWLRERLDAGLLEIHLLQARGLAGRFRAILAMARGTWRDLPHLQSLTATEVSIRLRRRRRRSVAVDGELRRMSGELAFVIRPGALELVTARKADPG